MGQVLFYHLTRSPAEDLIGQLLPRALAQGWRVMIRGTDAARLAWLEDRLWLGPEEGFLPHGLEGGPRDADQPVLLGQGAAVNGARGVMLIDGAQSSAEEARGLERLWVIFDGNDPAAVEAARAQWRDTAGWGLAAQYWSEAGGRWEKKTERPAP
mgnify:CR=1 FL=1